MLKKAAVKAIKNGEIVLRKGYIYKNYGKPKASKYLMFNLGKTNLNYVKQSIRVKNIVKDNQVRFKIQKIPFIGKIWLKFGVNRKI